MSLFNKRDFIEKYKLLKLQGLDVSRVEVLDFYNTYKDSIPLVPENFTFSVIEIPIVPGESSEKVAYNFLDSLRNLIKHAKNVPGAGPQTPPS